MDRQILTVEMLEAAGFARSGCWVAADARIRREGELPRCGGVYAFNVNGRVSYIGLASADLWKRLYFYQTPGVGQRTNLRLNGIIAEALKSESISIHYACPPGYEWNGLAIRGAEGLEAGLIRQFDLSWNVRGSAPRMVAPKERPIGPAALVPSPSDNRSLAERVVDAARRHPRRTEAEIANLIFGPGGYQQKVNPICRLLVQRGRLKRIGAGGGANPYVYVVT